MHWHKTWLIPFLGMALDSVRITQKTHNAQMWAFTLHQKVTDTCSSRMHADDGSLMGQMSLLGLAAMV